MEDQVTPPSLVCSQPNKVKKITHFFLKMSSNSDPEPLIKTLQRKSPSFQFLLHKCLLIFQILSLWVITWTAARFLIVFWVLESTTGSEMSPPPWLTAACRSSTVGSGVKVRGASTRRRLFLTVQLCFVSVMLFLPIVGYITLLSLGSIFDFFIAVCIFIFFSVYVRGLSKLAFYYPLH